MNIKALIPIYIKHLRTIGRAEYTIRGIKSSLRNFMGFLKTEKIFTLDDLTAEIMEEYQEDLAFSLTAKGTPLAIPTQIQILCNVKGFTAFLNEKDYLYQDPCAKITPPKPPKRLPRVILNGREIKKLMKAADMRTNRGYRNRVILEILYDTAIRRQEICNIKLPDLDLESGFIRIRGKSDKERVVPLSKSVCKMVKNYILFVRQAFVQGDDPGHLILNRWGDQMNPNSVWGAVKRCAQLSKIKKRVSPHTLRHTCATHMLKNGAPVRHIQEMLGHASINTTQIYTHVTINDLKEVHAKYHPGETMDRDE